MIRVPWYALIIFWAKAKKRYTYVFFSSPFQVHHMLHSGKGLLAPPLIDQRSIVAYCWLKGSRHTSLCLLKLGFTYFWL